MSQDNIVRLQCSQCKTINYETHRNLKRRDMHKLELQKFCNSCRQHSLHKEKAKS